MKLYFVVAGCSVRRFSSEIEKRGLAWGLLFIVAACVSVSVIAVVQEDASEQATRIAIRGTVLDSVRKPVSGALV
jgi:hypothetical protein